MTEPNEIEISRSSERQKTVLVVGSGQLGAASLLRVLEQGLGPGYMITTKAEDDQNVAIADHEQFVLRTHDLPPIPEGITGFTSSRRSKGERKRNKKIRWG